MPAPKNKLGENAFQRIVRLLNNFSMEVLKDPENEDIYLEVNINGSGEIIFRDIDNTETTFFQFTNFEKLEEFLTTSRIDQLLLASKTQA